MRNQISHIVQTIIMVGLEKFLCNDDNITVRSLVVTHCVNDKSIVWLKKWTHFNTLS